MHSKYSGDAGKQRPKGTKAAGVGGCQARSRKSKETSVVAKVGGNVTETAGDENRGQGQSQGENDFYVF